MLSEDFMLQVRDSLSKGSFVKLSLKHYTGVEDQLKKIDIRKILIKREEKLSFTCHYTTRDIIKNYSIPESLNKIQDYLNNGFHVSTLFTMEFDLHLETIRGRKETLRRSNPTQSAPASLDHDRSKTRLIAAEGKQYLRDLKITDDAGQVLKSAQDKYRQINKYIEILDALIRQVPAGSLRNIADMGSGKGYLTFALYDYLTSVMKLNPAVTGVEVRAELVDLCNRIAKNSNFSSLNFVQGRIDDYGSKDVDLLIALHACDTATDDAIHKGITAGAELIVVAPCCHKQIRREIESHKSRNDLDFLMRHGIFLERQAEMVTDGLRALILEYFGYTVKVFEFISDAHTPKNVMIAGIKNPEAKELDPAILQKIKNAKAYFGISSHHLEKLMGI
jgi:hypothetical protein